MFIGVTGKIASGKTEVLKLLEKRNFYVIDADKIVHKLYSSGGKAVKKIEKAFGPDFITSAGFVNRRSLRNLVFNNPSYLKKLNSLMWPIVVAEIRKIYRLHENLAVEAISLDHAFFRKNLDLVIWVERSSGKRKSILMKLRSFDFGLAGRALNLSTKPLFYGEKLRILENDASIFALGRKLDELLA